MKKVSLLMPCYNDGQYIEETFASIAAQTHTNIEVIVVDDGSDDGTTLPMLTALEAQGRCRLLHQAHQGPAAARNLAYRESTGDYLLPLDADDRIAPDYLEKTVAALESNTQAGVCYCHAAYFGNRTGPWQLPDYSLRAMLVDNVVFVTALIRRSVMEKIGGFDESFRTGMEDYDFFLSVLEQGYEILQLPETLFQYRIKPVSRSHRLAGNQSDYHATYHRLFEKHQALYLRYADTLIPDLRDAFLDARQANIDAQAQVIERDKKIIDLDFQLHKWKYRIKRVLGIK